MKNKLILILLLFTIFGSKASQKTNKASKTLSVDIEAARTVLSRVLGDRANSVKLEMLQAVEGWDTYKYVCTDGKLTVRGSSVSALSRGASGHWIDLDPVNYKTYDGMPLGMTNNVQNIQMSNPISLIFKLLVLSH